MISALLIFAISLAVLIFSAQKFTDSAENIGNYFKMPSFVIGVFIVGIGTSLPELVSAIVAVSKGMSEIVSGNVIGANISNILLITGTIAVFHRRDIVLSSKYIFIDLHYLLGSVFILALFSYDGVIEWHEAIIGILVFLFYSLYLIKNETPEFSQEPTERDSKTPFPFMSFVLLIAAGYLIYLSADYTVSSLEQIATALEIPRYVVALTILSIGTTLPELAVNLSAIKKGKAEMAVGNVLGSSVFNSLMVPSVASFFGNLEVPENLLHFSLPVLGACALFFYLITQDKRISKWEGILFIMIYILFLIEIVARN